MGKQFKTAIKTCPLCGGTERYRMTRSRKWKLLFFVRSYSCRICHSQYVLLFGFISMLVEKGFESFYIPGADGE